MRITMQRFRTPLVAAALLAGVSAIGLAPAFAQTAAAPANSAAAQRPTERMGHMMPGQLVDGRIAFLKTELKITHDQDTQWQQVAAAMRQNADALDQAITNARGHDRDANAVDRMEIRSQFAKVRADNEARLLTAFKPLYASLSPEQQLVANQLMTGGHHGWHHRA
jgi:periplasmic protein CpxP/Spy